MTTKPRLKLLTSARLVVAGFGLLTVACSTAGLWTGEKYAVFLQLPSSVVSKSIGLKADILVLNLTGDSLGFYFCDGGQYVMTFHDAFNRLALREPGAVVTMPTSFIIPPLGIHTIDADVSSGVLEMLSPGVYRIQVHIEYEQFPCAQAYILLQP